MSNCNLENRSDWMGLWHYELSLPFAAVINNFVYHWLTFSCYAVYSKPFFSFYPTQTYFLTLWTELIIPINQLKCDFCSFGPFLDQARILTEIYQTLTISLGWQYKLSGEKKLAFKGQKGHATADPPSNKMENRIFFLKMLVDCQIFSSKISEFLLESFWFFGW